MYILIKVLINVLLLVNEVYEYQNTRCNDKNYIKLIDLVWNR